MVVVVVVFFPRAAVTVAGLLYPTAKATTIR